MLYIFTYAYSCVFSMLIFYKGHFHYIFSLLKWQKLQNHGCQLHPYSRVR